MNKDSYEYKYTRRLTSDLVSIVERLNKGFNKDLSNELLNPIRMALTNNPNKLLSEYEEEIEKSKDLITILEDDDKHYGFPKHSVLINTVYKKKISEENGHTKIMSPEILTVIRPNGKVQIRKDTWILDINDKRTKKTGTGEIELFGTQITELDLSKNIKISYNWFNRLYGTYEMDLERYKYPKYIRTVNGAGFEKEPAVTEIDNEDLRKDLVELVDEIRRNADILKNTKEEEKEDSKIIKLINKFRKNN